MSFDFRGLLQLTPEATKAELELIQRQIGADVIERIQSHEYQKVITYLMLQRISPATVAQLLRLYLGDGRLPWSR